MLSAEQVRTLLNLAPLPGEGGFFRQTYQSDATLPISPSGTRHLSTAIYFLVTPTGFSALHRLISDEMYHFYGGDPLCMIQIDEQGALREFILGSDLAGGQVPQVLVPKGTWQGTRLIDGGNWGLIGATVAPGYEPADMELGDRAQLIAAYPHLAQAIERYTRPTTGAGP